jgi:predicted nicotinamide N-methyase
MPAPIPLIPFPLTTLLGAEADQLLTYLRSKFVCTVEPVDLGDATLELLRVADPDTLIENVDSDLFASEDRFPYWADLWNSGIGLARWVRATRILEHKRVLELGCGIGIVGIAAAQCGAVVTMTDNAQEALLFAAYNVKHNCPSAPIELRLLDWRNPGEIGPYDAIVGADILYERSDFDALFTLFKDLLAPRGIVLLTDPDRAMGNAFLAIARTRGFSVETTAIDLVRRDRTSRVTCNCLRRDPHREDLRP